ITGDGSPRGRKFFVFWDSTKYKESSVHVQTKNILVHTVKNNLQTLCFVVSRRLSELISFWIKNEFPKLKISSYRAGYLPSERREIERKLRQKELEGVVSTTALELGIDIGGLDSVIISGYPGTIASFFQQAGRAGRKNQDSLVFFIGFEDALDQYLLKHPEVLLSGNFENAIIDLSNPYILSGHLLCATSELPLKKENYGCIDIVDISALPKDIWLPRLKEANVIFVGGGNTFYLMSWLKKSGLDKILSELLRTRVYVGISAGSMVATVNLRTSTSQKFYSEKVFPLKDDNGLGFVNFHIRPHLNSEFFPKVRVEHLQEEAKEIPEPIYAIDDDSAVLVNDNKVEVISEGKWLRFN
ncbi:MAG: Type 1 glutamine amidotransferase-like domain-containing protein, partial [Nanoarchaeota archaeon]